MAEQTAEPLWCVNIHGPDDVVATASYLDAVKVAHRFNAFWLLLKERNGQRENDPLMWAVPIEWPYSAALHADAVASPSQDYVAIINDAALATEQSAS